MTRFLYLAWVYTMVGFWTLAVFPSSLIITLLTGSHRIGHRVHARFWARMILRTCGVRLRVHGIERLQRDKSYVLMINHNSHFAGYAMAASVPLQWRAVLALKLRKIPVFGWIGVLAGHIFIDTHRTPRAIASLNAAAEKIHGGLSVLIFPEGAYHAQSDLLPFRAGGFHLAVHAAVPIVPLTAVERRRPGTAGIVRVIDLYIDEPIPTTECTGNDIHQLMEQTRAVMIARLTETESEPSELSK